VKERIRAVSQIVDNLKSHVASGISRLDSLRSEVKQVVMLAEKAREREYKHVLCHQQQKLEALIEKKRRLPTENDLDLSGEWLKKWVVNILKYKEEAAVLSKGLNFTVSPESIP